MNYNQHMENIDRVITLLSSIDHEEFSEVAFAINDMQNLKEELKSTEVTKENIKNSANSLMNQYIRVTPSTTTVTLPNLTTTGSTTTNISNTKFFPYITKENPF